MHRNLIIIFFFSWTPRAEREHRLCLSSPKICSADPLWEFFFSGYNKLGKSSGQSLWLMNDAKFLVMGRELWRRLSLGAAYMQYL